MENVGPNNSDSLDLFEMRALLVQWTYYEVPITGAAIFWFSSLLQFHFSNSYMAKFYSLLSYSTLPMDD